MTATRTTPTPRPDDDATSISGVIDLVKTYAQQETIGPLKGAGRWLAMGTAGAALLGLGLSYMLLGLLRLIQTEWDRAASGSLSWLAYLLVFAVCVLLIVFAVSRINRDSLNKESE